MNASARLPKLEHRTNGSNSWGTPLPFLANLCRSLRLPWPELDCAADETFSVADRYFGPGGEREDAIESPWRSGGTRFLNPPYGRTCTVCPDRVWKGRGFPKEQQCSALGHKSRTIKDWMEKANAEGCRSAAGTLICLVPARVGTDWWHDNVLDSFALARIDIYYVRGRLSFWEWDDAAGKSRPAKDPAGFPSAVVIYTPGGEGLRHGTLTQQGLVERTAT